MFKIRSFLSKRVAYTRMLPHWFIIGAGIGLLPIRQQGIAWTIAVLFIKSTYITHTIHIETF